jgi:hypothetical protein
VVTGRPPQIMPTGRGHCMISEPHSMDILSVARRARVLTAIVSRVISSNKVRETSAKLVREAILGLQYVPNNSA